MRLRRATCALALGLALSSWGTACGSGEKQASPTEAPPPAARPATKQAQPSKQPTSNEKATRRARGRSDGDKSSYDPSQPDQPGNDKPPPAGSPAAHFEQRCKKNPGQCD